MKSLVGLFCLLLVVSCSSEDNKNATPDPGSTPNSAIAPPPNTAPPVNNKVNTQPMPAPTSAVGHYLCPKACVGGTGNEAGPCPVCGTTMAHNQAFHDQQQNPADPNAPNPNAQKPPEPPQNAKGVWHYTCSKGCAGGAGSAAACAGCGTTLTHNTAYHEN